MNYEQEIEYINERFPDINTLSQIEMQLVASEITQYILNFSDSIPDTVKVIYHIQDCLDGKYKHLEKILGTFQNKSNTENKIVYENGEVRIER